MTDGNWVLERAEALMDETVEDRDRVLEILNVLRQEVYPCSETFVYGQVCPELKRLEQFLELDDRTAQMILPYGLAAQLLLGEDDKPLSESDQHLAQTVAGFLGRQLEN